MTPGVKFGGLMNEVPQKLVEYEYNIITFYENFLTIRSPDSREPTSSLSLPDDPTPAYEQ